MSLKQHYDFAIHFIANMSGYTFYLNVETVIGLMVHFLRNSSPPADRPIQFAIKSRMSRHPEATPAFFVCSACSHLIDNRCASLSRD